MNNYTTTLKHPSTTLCLCLSSVGLCHGVQSATVLEPLDLRSVESVGKLDFESLAVLGVNLHGEGLANLKLSAQKIDLKLTVSYLHFHGIRF